MKNIGDLQIHKGVSKEGLRLVMWDAIPDCTEKCPIENSCPYDRTRRKCEMRRRYLESVLTSLDEGIKEKDELKMMQLGMMLIPLFSQLVTFKIFGHGLQHQVMNRTKVHPIYREIRGTIRDINSILKEMGVSGEGKKGLADAGDDTYYDTMIKKGSVPS